MQLILVMLQSSKAGHAKQIKANRIKMEQRRGAQTIPSNIEKNIHFYGKKGEKNNKRKKDGDLSTPNFHKTISARERK